MLPLTPESFLDLPLLSVESPAAVARAADEDVLRLFDQCAAPLLRYVAAFGLSTQEAEDVVQDVFVALFRHLRLGRSRRNLPGWLFRVAHNHALKQRRRIQRRAAAPWDAAVHAHADPAPGPEASLIAAQRQRRLAPVLQALPARDRQCLMLRADGLRYRDIARALDMSLGGVAKSLARSITRFVNADR
jgi:RNA polymerase sigma-70 factor (ECF subfamily)